MVLLACSSPSGKEPNPQPDGHKETTTACPRTPNIPTMCMEFYADEAVQLHIRVDALDDEAQHASSPLGDVVMPLERTITVFPGGGAVGYSIALKEGRIYTMTGKATGAKGILIGCRVIHRGKEVAAASFFGDNGLAPCSYTGR